MGFVLMRNIEDSGLLGLWSMSESVNELLSIVPLSESEKETFQKFKAETRKKEWLCVRMLVKELIGDFAKINYTESGKPQIDCKEYKFISITHTKNLVGVLLSPNNEVGIDAEFVNDRIERVAHKFMSKDEIESVGEGERFVNYYIHWCSKEVLTKLTDCKTYDFVNELKLEKYQLQKEGSFIADILIGQSIKSYVISYLILDEYVVTWSH